MSQPYSAALRAASLLIAALLLFAAAWPASAQQPLVVGQVIDQSGFNADASRDFLAGAKTLFDAVNAAGGVNGRRIVHRVLDDGGDPARTVQQTRELLEKENADVLFGYFGDANVQALVADGAYQRSGAALVGAVCGVDLGTAGRNAFFTRASYALEAQRIIDQFGSLGVNRFAIAHADTASGRATAAAIGERLKGAQLTLTGSRAIRSDGAEPREEVAALQAGGPQVVIVLADSLATAAFIKLYRRGNAGVFLVGLSVVNAATVTELIGAQSAAGTLLTQVVPDPGRTDVPLVTEHLRLMKKYRDEPPSNLTLEGFLAAKALVQSLKRLPRSAGRAEVARALRDSERLDLGGVMVDFSRPARRGYDFVDIAFLRRNGSLLR